MKKNNTEIVLKMEIDLFGRKKMVFPLDANETIMKIRE